MDQIFSVPVPSGAGLLTSSRNVFTPAAEPGILVNAFSYERYFRSPAHVHEETAAIVITRGAAQYTQFQTVETVNAGEALITHGGVWHASVYGVSPEGSTRTEGVALTLNQETMNRFVSRSRGMRVGAAEHVLFLGKIAVHELLPAVEDLIAVSRRAIPQDWLLQDGAEDVLSQLLRRWPANLVFREGREGSSCLTRMQFIRALEYMADARISNFQVEHLADELGISRHRFFDLFRRSTKRTPADCFRGLLVERAKVSLLDPIRQIKEVSYDLGFSSPSHFSATFRRVAGMTPEDFRRRCLVQAV